MYNLYLFFDLGNTVGAPPIALVKLLSHAWLFGTPWTATWTGFPVHHQFPEFTQTHVYWFGDAIQPSHPLSSPSPPALNLSQDQGLFQCQFFTLGGRSTGVSASASVLPRLIYLQLDWLDLLAVQGTLKHLLQHHSSKASILWH